MTKNEFEKLAKKHLFVMGTEDFKGETQYNVYGIGKLYEALSAHEFTQSQDEKVCEHSNRTQHFSDVFGRYETCLDCEKDL